MVCEHSKGSAPSREAQEATFVELLAFQLLGEDISGTTECHACNTLHHNGVLGEKAIVRARERHFSRIGLRVCVEWREICKR